ncbi:helix-turn-helix domain-containing protein [Streptomyces sp. ISL-86]|uniref:helix-turn-helix domain-containing protein n=1 Tax=Streptomyces sp. ISL-86 TaxID=2819187 RepID=UPI001BEAA6FE|nr:helix-turn-helix domain-containing protein [Streptomyces sp. ISL-86]MBT2458873.1 helix-turn-helix transcriptional regulator [Streptomyces sp. ISL-86]
MTDEAFPHLKSLARLEELIEEAELDWAEILDPGPLSLSTGLPVSVVVAGLHRRAMPTVSILEQVGQRLEFLRTSRLRPDGRPYTLKEIGDGAGLTSQWLRQIVKGEKKPSLEHAARIEDFFQVPRGFLTATPSQALDRALRDRLEDEQAKQMAEFRSRNQLNSVAFRGIRGASPQTLAAVQALVDSIATDNQDK